jgi:hypothetical protein
MVDVLEGNRLERQQANAAPIVCSEVGLAKSMIGRRPPYNLD